MAHESDIVRTASGRLVARVSSPPSAHAATMRDALRVLGRSQHLHLSALLDEGEGAAVAPMPSRYDDD